MAWLARSLVNSLRVDLGVDDEDDERSAMEEEDRIHRAAAEEEGEERRLIGTETPTRGVKEDLSELTQTLTRQFWGVASFLAPPPTAAAASSSQSPSSPLHLESPSSGGVLRPDPPNFGGSGDPAESESPRFAGIRSDLAEIGGRFKSGISMLSSNKTVHEISKLASTFIPFGSEEVDEDEEVEEEEEEDNEESAENFGAAAVGVTDEVLAFARNISMHSETWLDFPLFSDDEDSDEFYMSDAQQEHAVAIEHLAPRLAALRIELCPSHMSEGCFWKIYFVLLHPRLNKHDAEILSTPQIVQARAMLLQDLQNRTRPDSGRSGKDASYSEEARSTVPLEENVKSPSIRDETTPPPKILTLEEPTTSVPLAETEKHPVETTEMTMVDKSVIEEEPPMHAYKDFPSNPSNISNQKYEEDADEWLEEETGETAVSRGATIPLGNDEDVSFSDLEEDDDDGVVSTSSKTTTAIDSPTKDESGWVQLKKSSGGEVKGASSSSSQRRESNDWLDVDIGAV